MIRAWWLRILISVLAAAPWAAAQDAGSHLNTLPAPSGAYRVGRLTLLCEDSSRIEPLDPKAAARRIAVDVWYPANSTAPEPTRAAYLDVTAFERALGADALRKYLGPAYARLKEGGVLTNAVADAPFATAVKRAPVLLFSPGGGMIKELYTAQLEELASHGYVVAAITHSYDGFLAIFPDGSYVARDGKRWPKIPSFEGEANLNQLEWHADDMLVVLNHLQSLHDYSQLSNVPFAGRMDLGRVGAFGHSFGGVAAARVAQKDRRIKACLNQDGAMGMKPFYPDPSGWGLNQPFMLIERPPNREPLSDADLAEMKLTRARAAEVIERLHAGRDRLMRSTGGGSYRVLLERSRTTHMDFSDLQSLGATDRAEAEQRMRTLSVVRDYTRGFFDKYLRGVKAPLLDRIVPEDDGVVESIQRFVPASKTPVK